MLWDINLWRRGIGEINEGFGELTLRNWKVKSRILGVLAVKSARG